MEMVNLINGNNQHYQLELPKIVIITDFINDVALAHLQENTDLTFKKDVWNSYSAAPNASNQVMRLFMTYNFKSCYYNNAMFKNELHLKFCDTGFKVSHICFDCCKQNHIYTGDMTEQDRLSV